MPYEDKKLACQDCQKEFVWSAGEQEFFAQKGFENIPKRCPDCRKQRRHDGPKPQVKVETGAEWEVACKECGKKDMVDFKPRNPENILCEECFLKEKSTKTKE